MSRSILFTLRFIIDNIGLGNNPLTRKITFGLSSFVTFGHCAYTFGTTENKIINIQNKYQFTSNGFTEFMVVDNTGSHYNVNNSLWYWKWNSIEDWEKIKVDTQISVKYYGWRIPFLGIFPNIVKSSWIDKLD